MSSENTQAVFKITPGVQSYDWGKKGPASLAAQFAKVSVGDGFEIQEDKPYAELWMGTHPNLPSKLTLSPETLLSTYVKSNPSLVGETVLEKFPDSKDGALPFLFKVLSIGTALSIQAHPDKPLAKKLFDERPDVYKDPNHKPEMAIALTPFLAFLNFLPLPTLLLNLLTVPELDSIIPSSSVEALATSLTLPSTRPADPQLYQPTTSSPTPEQKTILKEIFKALMSADESLVKESIRSLVNRYEKGEDIAESEKSLVELTLMLNEQYPDDVGVLCVFFLNVVELKKGEAAFLGANEPHAYIKGDIIECMATSDNVVRAGLTPKLRDVDTLISMLTYEAGPGDKQLLRPTPFSSSSNDDSSTVLYDPPIDEFSVLRLEITKDQRTTSHRAIKGPSMVIITQGKGKISWDTKEKQEGGLEFERGDVLFISADVKVNWELTGEDDLLEAFRAFIEV